MFTRIDRPWGRMWLLFHLPFLWVKVIVVNSNHRTSVQIHRERTELHIALRLHREGWYGRKVPKGHVHVLATGRYIEIAWGRPREEDIIRLADQCGHTLTPPDNPCLFG